jgi:hypothetical protein
MQIRPADVRGGDPDDRIEGSLDLRILDLLDRDIKRTFVHDCLHHKSFLTSGSLILAAKASPVDAGRLADPAVSFAGSYDAYPKLAATIRHPERTTGRSSRRERSIG